MKRSLFLLALVSLLLASCIGLPSPTEGIPPHAAMAATATANPTRTTVTTPAPAVNQTTHGHMVRDEIWRGEIHVVGDIVVDDNVTLTIEPGTVVSIASNQDVENLFYSPIDMRTGIQNEADNISGVHLGEPYRDEGHHISIHIEGTLRAVGTPEQMITFTSDSPTPSIYDWNHFTFAHGILSYSVVQYYRVISPGNGTEISHNVLQHIGECGVCANSTVVVESNAVSDAGHELIDMHQSSPVIRNNTLGPNSNRAGIVIDGGSPQIVNNNINGCGVGIDFISPPGSPNLEANTFVDNGQDILHEY